MWVYEQSTGRLMRDGRCEGVGWAGQPPHKNDPNAQHLPNVGPLPRGRYKIEGPPYTHPKLGVYVLNLAPQPDEGETSEPYPHMLGRFAFRIHGASRENPDFSSEGCVILPRHTREALWQSGDRDFEVVK